MAEVRSALGLLLILGVFCCGGGAGIGQACEKESSPRTRTGTCADDLVCNILDSCSGTCPGQCVLRCAKDADCPKACTCSGNLTPENAGILGAHYCQGTGC